MDTVASTNFVSLQTLKDEHQGCRPPDAELRLAGNTEA